MTVMKMNNIFGKNGSLLMAGALAFTFASCDTDTRSEQSVKNETESRYEDGRTADDGVNDPSITYDQGEYNTTDDNMQMSDNRMEQEDFNQYSYEDRDQLIERVRNDLDRAKQSMEELSQRFENETAEATEETKQTWEESRRGLEERQTELNQRLSEAESSTEENWEQVKNNISESLDELEQEWDKLKEKDININNTNGQQDLDENGTMGNTGERNQKDVDPNTQNQENMNTEGGTTTQNSSQDNL